MEQKQDNGIWFELKVGAIVVGGALLYYLVLEPLAWW